MVPLPQVSALLPRLASLRLVAIRSHSFSAGINRCIVTYFLALLTLITSPIPLVCILSGSLSVPFSLCVSHPRLASFRGPLVVLYRKPLDVVFPFFSVVGLAYGS